MADFGSDLSCTDDLDANGREVSGEELVGEAIYRRLTTARGTLIDDPDYGLDVRSFVQAGLTPGKLAEIGGLIRVELAKDETIAESSVNVRQTSTNALEAKVEVLTGEGPFELVFDITTETVRRILEDV